MASEIVVTVKDEEKTLKRKFLQYEEDAVLTLSRQDATLANMVEQVCQEFEGEPDDVVLKITMVW